MISLSAYDSKILLIESERLSIFLKVVEGPLLDSGYEAENRNVCLDFILTVRQKIRRPT